MPAYSSNASLADVAQRLGAARRVAIFTHAKPDGDALGSTLALARALRLRHIEATPVYLPPWSSRFDAIVDGTPVLHMPADPAAAAAWLDRPELTTADTFAVLDTGSWSQLSHVRPLLEPRAAQCVIVDHHAHGDESIASVRHIDVRAASACELVAEVCRLILGAGAMRELPVSVAEPLYLGVATDTGWFRYSNTKPATLRLAADLIDAGVDHNRLYRRIEQSDSPRRLLLTQRALASLEYLAADRAAIMSITQRDVAECKATQDELGGLTDLPQSVGSVRAVAVLTEVEPALSKVSFRSKAADAGQRVIDVNQLAQQFGGGGHVHAAGAKIALPLAEARRKVADALAQAVSA
jgi:bifunctional oligoribonuclease and PAP phosphatase NrnA